MPVRHGQTRRKFRPYLPTDFGLIDPKLGGEKRVRTKWGKERVKKRVSTMINEAPGCLTCLQVQKIHQNVAKSTHTGQSGSASPEAKPDRRKNRRVKGPVSTKQPAACFQVNDTGSHTGNVA